MTNIYRGNCHCKVGPADKLMVDRDIDLLFQSFEILFFDIDDEKHRYIICYLQICVWKG